MVLWHGFVTRDSFFPARLKTRATRRGEFYYQTRSSWCTLLRHAKRRPRDGSASSDQGYAKVHANARGVGVVGAGQDDRALHGIGHAGTSAVDEGRSPGRVDHGGIRHAAGLDAAAESVAEDRAYG